MTEQERTQILKMIENGKITPEEGLHLMQTLDCTPVEESPQVIPAGKSFGDNPAYTRAEGSHFDTNPRIENLKANVQRFWQIPLWIGMAVLCLSAYGMYAIQQTHGMNFWFFLLILPLLLGLLTIVAAAGSRQARWIYVDVQQKPGDHPGRIFLGFPLPLKLAAWFLRTFGPIIPRLEKTHFDEALLAIESGISSEEPLLVDVEEDEEGHRVQVYLG